MLDSAKILNAFKNIYNTYTFKLIGITCSYLLGKFVPCPSNPYGSPRHFPGAPGETGEKASEPGRGRPGDPAAPILWGFSEENDWIVDVFIMLFHLCLIFKSQPRPEHAE